MSLNSLLIDARKIRRGRRYRKREDKIWTELYPILRKYCYAVAKKYTRDRDELEDYVSQGVNGAIKALDNFWYVCTCKKRFHTLEDFDAHTCPHSHKGPRMTLEDYTKGSMRSYMNKVFVERLKYVCPERYGVLDSLNHLHWSDPLALSIMGITPEVSLAPELVNGEDKISLQVRGAIKRLNREGDRKAVIVLAGYYAGMKREEIVAGLRGLFDIGSREAYSIVSKALYRINKVSDGRVRITATGAVS